MKKSLLIQIFLLLIIFSCQKREWNNLYDSNNILDKTLPIILDETVSIVTFNSAKSGGSITLAGGSPVTARGVCWSTKASPTIGSSKTSDGTGVGSFKSNIYELTNNIKYYFRAYATNSIGTAYGSEYSVILYMNVPDASVTDIDGNVYKTVKIGTQIWMAENLKTTLYRDGTPIPNITDATSWANLTTDAYCYFTNSTSIGGVYGGLYNYFAVVDNRGLCPVGWHVPTDNEWMILRDYLGGINVAGGKLKETGTTHWSSPNTGADNSSGFTAFAGSWRGGDGNFYYGVHTAGWWWTSTTVNSTDAWFYYIGDNSIQLLRSSTDPYFHKKAGCSVRCIKD